MKHELPALEDVLKTCEATWPAIAQDNIGAWIIRDGGGGGKRVSAATPKWPTTEADLPIAEKAMNDLGIDPLFQLGHDDEHLDEMLAKHGYDVTDPVNIWAIEVSELIREEMEPMSAFDIWPPLSIMTDLWEDGGIDKGRRAVMERANCKKTALLARTDNKAAGVGFVGLHNDIAMVHALHVDEEQRRKGTGKNLVRQAGLWAHKQGAKYLTLIVTQGNHAANPLYTNLGMHLIGHYHYRIKSP
jgi:GNAT superfamily N-acetyltransferase